MVCGGCSTSRFSGFSSFEGFHPLSRPHSPAPLSKHARSLTDCSTNCSNSGFSGFNPLSRPHSPAPLSWQARSSTAAAPTHAKAPRDFQGPIPSTCLTAPRRPPGVRGPSPTDFQGQLPSPGLTAPRRFLGGRGPSPLKHLALLSQLKHLGIFRVSSPLQPSQPRAALLAGVVPHC